MNTRRLVSIYVAAMVGLFLWAFLFTEHFLRTLNQPGMYLHAKLIHVLSVMMLFSNSIIGAIWEARSLQSGDIATIRFTYKTVVWLDAVLMAPLILLAAISGIMLGTILGGVWNLKFTAIGLPVFMAVGVLWMVADIPTQYKVNRILKSLPSGAKPTRELVRLLWIRVAIAFAGVIPLLFVFGLMIYKPA